MLHSSLTNLRYLWPARELAPSQQWRQSENSLFNVRELPESQQELAEDSRWPALWPSPIGLVTNGDGEISALERVVAPCLVNRFPFILALTFCNEEISQRHHPRHRFMDLLQQNKTAAVQFLPPGPALGKAMSTVSQLGDGQVHERIKASGLETHAASTCPAPVFDDAYLVYEVELVSQGRDMLGQTIFELPWREVGSHRLFFLEVRCIQLRKDIAQGQSQVLWRSLPDFTPELILPKQGTDESVMDELSYTKGFSANYRFPAAGTTAFEYDRESNGMCIKDLPSEPADQVEIDNDRARWPCFFPASLGLITSWAPDGRPDVMPCGSVTMVSRSPLIIGACVCYADVNDRYYSRRTLSHARQNGRFGCAVPTIDDDLLSAIAYTGNVSMAKDPDKVAHGGLQLADMGKSPAFTASPVHFDCKLVDEVHMGTHSMLLGEVRRIYARNDVTPQNPLEWCPFATVVNSI